MAIVVPRTTADASAKIRDIAFPLKVKASGLKPMTL
jgi:hypothetical protein